MALIKCSECGKEISDKAKTCVHCGCPIEMKKVCGECGNLLSKDDKVCSKCGCPISNYGNNHVKLGIKVWLIICAIICFILASIFITNVFGLNINIIKFGDSNINIMGILTFLLGVSYIGLFKTMHKYEFYSMIAINLIIFLYNLSTSGLFISLFFMMCAITNLLITCIVVRKNINKEKGNIKKSLPIYIAYILGTIVILFIGNAKNSSSVLGTYVQDGGVETTIILEKDNVCSMSVLKQVDNYPSTISNCHWSLDGDKITINYTMSMSSAFVQNYTRDGSLSGTLYDDYIEMDAGAIYYKK